jgi:uncharacterized protein (DUF433 family)
MFNKIESIQDKLGGAPTVVGRRISVYNIVSMLYLGEPLEAYIKEYDLSFEIVDDAINYCKHLQCKNAINYCDGCILRCLKDSKANFHIDNRFEEIIIEGDKFAISLDGGEVFLGSKAELENEELGRPGWRMAQAIKIKNVDKSGS